MPPLLGAPIARWPTCQAFKSASILARQLSSSRAWHEPPRNPPHPANIRMVAHRDIPTTKPNILQTPRPAWPVRTLPENPLPDPLKDMSNPFDSATPFSEAEWHLPTSNSFKQFKPQRKMIRTVPSTGRAVYVTGSVDQARAFQLCQVMCRQNRVASDFNKQKFHERGGLKRKRLKSERWRKRFKSGFIAAAKRVRQLADQGW